MKNVNRLHKSFFYAFRGLWIALSSEQNFVIDCFACGAAVLAGWYFRISRLEWAAILLASALVLGFELLNSALERILDMVNPRLDVRVSTAKDVAAAAVLVTSFVALAVGALVFLPYCYRLLK